MKYYRLRVLSDNKEAYLDQIELSKDIKYKIIDGEALDIDKTSITIKNKTKKIPDFMGHSSDSPIISDKFKSILEALTDKHFFQFIPCSISNIKTEKAYWLLNIVENIYSTFEDDTEIHKINALVMNEEVIKNRNIFRIKEAPLHIFVSETLKSTLETQGISGLWFIRNMDLTTNKEID